MRLTIYRKLMIGFGLVIGLMIVVNVYTLSQLYDVSAITQNTLSSDVLVIDLAKAVQSYLTDEERYAQKYVITGDSTYIGLLHDRTLQVETILDSILELPSDSLQSIILHSIYLSHQGLAISFDRARTRRVARSVAGAWTDSLRAIYGSLDDLVRRNQLLIGESMTRVESGLAQTANIVLVLMIGTMLVAITAALVISRTITRPIRILERGTAQIARGVFEPITVTSQDEIAQLAAAVNDMAGKLKQANEAKAEMMHTISHELRTPLQTVLSAQYLLVEEKVGPLNDEQQRLLAIVRQNIDKLSSFSHQFLDLEKMEAGMMEYKFERVNVHLLLSRIVEETRLDATRKRLHIALGGLTHADVLADPARLATAFSNLLSNAVKYTPEGGRIEVGLASATGAFRISFSDTGIGIGPDEIPKLFTKFFRASNARTENARGTGIGLALVRAIIEAHKGKLRVESELGKGSTFIVELPAAPSEGKNT
ncbi:MAG: ATP-binding protein [Bacteroidota bacterium]